MSTDMEVGGEFYSSNSCSHSKPKTNDGQKSLVRDRKYVSDRLTSKPN